MPDFVNGRLISLNNSRCVFSSASGTYSTSVSNGVADAEGIVSAANIVLLSADDGSVNMFVTNESIVCFFFS